MAKKKFNQDEFGWTLRALRKDLNNSNNLKTKEMQQQKEIAEKQLEVKDRVDLSLKEYKEMQKEIETLKSKIETLESNNDFLEGLIKEFKIWDMLQIIDYTTIKTWVNDDWQENKKKVHITFNINPLEL